MKFFKFCANVIYWLAASCALQFENGHCKHSQMVQDAEGCLMRLAVLDRCHCELLCVVGSLILKCSKVRIKSVSQR